MRELIGLVVTMIEASGANQRRHTAAGAMMMVAAGFIIALGALGVLICLLTALWVYEMPQVGDVGAALVVAAVLAGVTAIAGLVLHHNTRQSEPPPAPGINIGALVNVAESVMKSNKFLVLIGAGLIGLAAGENNSRRR